MSTPKKQFPPWLSRAVNAGLALYLGAECAYGILDGEGGLDTVWWLLVTAILLVNVLRWSSAIEEDTRWFVWVICVASMLHVMAFEWGEESRIANLALVFIVLAGDLNLIYLGRSFAILPARREIRRGWVYRLVRHPIYACYMFADVIYLTQMPSVRNFAVFGGGIVLFTLRAGFEERLLRNDPVYGEYARQTRWRFLPYVY